MIKMRGYYGKWMYNLGIHIALACPHTYVTITRQQGREYWCCNNCGEDGEVDS